MALMRYFKTIFDLLRDIEHYIKEMVAGRKPRCVGLALAVTGY